ncbi:MAG: hypothetical protein ACREO3_01840, partial [Arenimonas sp.]
VLDIESLVGTHVQNHCDDPCADRRLRVKDGRIGTLTVRSLDRGVAIDEAAKVAHIILALGDEVDYELGGLRQAPPQVTILGPADPFPPAPPAIDESSTGPAPEPPRAD